MKIITKDYLLATLDRYYSKCLFNAKRKNIRSALIYFSIGSFINDLLIEFFDFDFTLEQDDVSKSLVSLINEIDSIL